MQELEFLLDMLSMVLLAGLCSIIFSKLKMPPIIGYLLAGILLVNVFTIPDSSKSIIEIMSHLGLVMLMFGIGMELNLSKLKKDGRFAIIVAVIQLPLMMLIGFMVGRYMGFDSGICIALGAIISGSSTAVVAAVMKLQDRVSKETVDTLILVTIMEDIGQVIILSMVTPVFAGNEMEMIAIIQLIIKIVGFMLLSILLGVKVLPKILDWIGDNTTSEVLLIVSIGFCFLMAYLSVYIGMSMAIGAFIMGVIVSQSKFYKELEEKVEPMKDLFMSIFFISIGMEVSIQGLVDNIGLALIILVTFMLGKLFTVFLGYFVGGKSITESFVCAMSLMAMGEFAFIIAEQARTHGVIDNGFYTAVIVAALLSMIVLPVMSRYTYNFVDHVEKRPNSLLYRLGMKLLAMRADMTEGIQASNLGSRFKKQSRTLYGSFVLMIIVEIVFISFSDAIVENLAKLIAVNHDIALMLFFVINLVALMVPTLFFVSNIKSMGRMLSEGKSAPSTSLYHYIGQFSTITFVIIIDLLIMILVPGPFGWRYLLIMLPVFVAMLIISYILIRRKAKEIPADQDPFVKEEE